LFGLFEDKKKMQLELEILKNKEGHVDAILQDMLYEILHVKGEYINEQDKKEMGEVVVELTNLMLAVSTKVKNEFIQEVLCINSGEVTFERVRNSMINFATYKLSISDRVDPTYYAGPFDETKPFNQRKYNEHMAKMNKKSGDY